MKSALWPDNDEPGIAHMSRIANRLMRLGSHVGLVRWSSAPDHGDAADFLDSGGTSDALRQLPIIDARLVDAVWAESTVDAHRRQRTNPAQTRLLERAPERLHVLTAIEFARVAPVDVDWVARPYVAAGSITLIDGKIKTAGKTTFLTHLCRALVAGLPFLDQPTAQTDVLYLTEQPAMSFRQTLRRADLLGQRGFSIVNWRDCLGLPWPGLVASAVDECDRRGAGVLVVDTLGRFVGLRGDDENSAAEADAVMAPLLMAAHDGLAVIVLRHERKAGGDVGDSGRGSSAYGGAADIVLAIKHGEGGTPRNVRLIHALSRFDETPEVLAVELTAEGYLVVGETVAVLQHRVAERVLAALQESTHRSQTLEELTAATRATRSTIQRAIASLVESGRAARVGGGRKGDPYRWRALTAETAMRPWTEQADSDDWVLGTA